VNFQEESIVRFEGRRENLKQASGVSVSCLPLANGTLYCLIFLSSLFLPWPFFAVSRTRASLSSSSIQSRRQEPERRKPTHERLLRHRRSVFIVVLWLKHTHQGVLTSASTKKCRSMIHFDGYTLPLAGMPTLPGRCNFSGEYSTHV
jgi:hypothetical protein